MGEGPRFNAEGLPLFDAVGQPIICVADAGETDCCNPCAAFLKCLLRRRFIFRSDGAPLINLLDKFTQQFVMSGGTPDATDAGLVQDLSAEAFEKLFCLTGSPAVLLGFGQYEHLDGDRTRNVFDGSFVLEPIAGVDPFDINDDGATDMPTLCAETHLAEGVEYLWLIPDRTPCVDDFDPAFAGFGEGCGTRPRSMPVRLGLKVTCSEGMLTFTIVLIYHRHYWTAAGDGVVDVETGELEDGTYGCPCISYYCLDWLTSAPIDLSTATPADLVDIPMLGDTTPEDCFDAFYDTDPAATLSMAPPTCDLIQDCEVCEPDEDPLTPLELVEIDFTYTASGDQPEDGAMAFLHAVIPDCLEVDPDDIIWSFGATGEHVSHLMEVPCEDEESDATFCEEVTLTVIDARGCIYKVTKTIYSAACVCPEGEGTLGLALIGTDPETTYDTFRFTASIFDCPTGFIELQGGDGAATCEDVDDCDCSDMLELTPCREPGAGPCIFALGDGETFDYEHSQTLQPRSCWRWRFWDCPCGCVGPWNEYFIPGTFEEAPDSRECSY